MNKNDVRAAEFAMRREWAEKQTSEELKRQLVEGGLPGLYKTAAREVLRQRGEA